MLPQAQITEQAAGTQWLVIPAPSWYIERHPNKKIVGVWQVKHPVTNRRHLVVRRRPVEGNGNGGHEWDCDCPNGLRDDGLCEHVEAVLKSLGAESEPAQTLVGPIQGRTSGEHIIKSLTRHSEPVGS